MQCIGTETEQTFNVRSKSIGNDEDEKIMSYTSLNLYKKVIEMIQANQTKRFIMQELEIDHTQYKECLEMYNRLIEQKNKPELDEPKPRL